MDGITGVLSRIAAIEARFGDHRAVTGAPRNRSAVTFDEVLAAQVTPRTTSITTPAQRLAPGQYGPLVPPGDLVAFGNGRLPDSVLAPIGSGPHQLWPPSAAAFQQLLDAARAEGIEIGITDSYRDLATQQRLAAEKGLYSRGGLAATPGSSPHGWGLAVDLDLDPAAQAWMRANAWRYGFVEDVPREPWHWTYRPAT